MAFGDWSGTELTTANGNAPSSSTLNTSLGVNVPIGTMIGWAKSLTGTPALPAGGCWVECNGQVLSDADSPLNGTTIPDLNGNHYLLRGATTSGGTGGAATHNHTFTYDHNHGEAGSVTAAVENNNPVTVGDSNNYPPYYYFVYICRVK